MQVRIDKLLFLNTFKDSVGCVEEIQGPGTVKQRLFFVVRKEFTDEEIIKKIGKNLT